MRTLPIVATLVVLLSPALPCRADDGAAADPEADPLVALVDEPDPSSEAVDLDTLGPVGDLLENLINDRKPHAAAPGTLLAQREPERWTDGISLGPPPNPPTRYVVRVSVRF